MPDENVASGSVDIYDRAYLERLFDDMAGTYEVVNLVSSFGMSWLWREQFVGKIKIEPGMTVCDYMSGMGECWRPVRKRLSGRGRIIALEISRGMIRGSQSSKSRLDGVEISIRREDALSSTVPDGSVDCVVCGFGVKTLSLEQQSIFASEMARILRPSGSFALIDVSVPKGWVFERIYMFYLKMVIPVIGRIFLGNPEAYRMLGIYTERFGDCSQLRSILDRQGFVTHYHRYFCGCATGISGSKNPSV